MWCALLFALLTTVSAVRLPRAVASHMVLQADAPALFGFGTPGETVTITVSDGETVHTTVSADGKWRMALKERAAKDVPYTIHINATSGGNVLEDVLFGDVWVCSGQSNMEFSVAEAFDAAAIIKGADIPALRLFAVQKNASSAPLDDVVDVQLEWVRSSPGSVCGAEYHEAAAYCMPHCGPSAANHSFARPTWGYFSAVCYLTGRELYRSTGRPQGMIESCWGGTSIERWSSARALEKCKAATADTGSMGVLPTTKDTEVSGTLWNGMIVPLLNMTIRGVLWYQGEANAKNAATSALYACQMKAMVDDWRSHWQNEPLSNRVFPFIMAQLAADDSKWFPELRWSQAAASVGPGAAARVGMGVNIDLADPTSPCGSVHIRNKTTVALRMARSVRHIAYGDSVGWTGPLPVDFAHNSTVLRVTFANGSLPLSFTSVAQTKHIGESFEIEMNSKWMDARATVEGAVVSVKIPGDITAVRYAWTPVAEQTLLFDAEGLPGGPFHAVCKKNVCHLEYPAVPKL